MHIVVWVAQLYVVHTVEIPDVFLSCFLRLDFFGGLQPEKDKAHFPATECTVEGYPALCPGFQRGQSTMGGPGALWNACHCALSFSGSRNETSVLFISIGLKDKIPGWE